MNRTRRVSQLLIVVAALTGMTGCYAADWLTFGPVAPATNPPPTLETMACSWQWATQPLPDLSADVAAALTGADFPVIEAGASAYGENCVRQDGTVDHFATMQTEFDITLAIASLDDRETLGNLVADVVAVLMDEFPVSETPGPNLGQIRLRFVTDDGERRLLLDRSDIAQHLTRGDLRGAALLDALGF